MSRTSGEFPLLSSNPNPSISLTPSPCHTQTHISPLLGPSCECATCNDPGHLPVPALLRPALSFLYPFFSPSIFVQSSMLTHFLCSSSPGPAEPLILHSVLVLPTSIPQTHRFDRIKFLGIFSKWSVLICCIYIKLIWHSSFICFNEKQWIPEYCDP